MRFDTTAIAVVTAVRGTAIAHELGSVHQSGELLNLYLSIRKKCTTQGMSKT